MLPQKQNKKCARLRVCASCEWVFKFPEKFYWKDGTIVSTCCPKCGFGASYGARSVYGEKCYRYQKNQQPWLTGKMHQHKLKLLKDIKNAEQK